MSAPVVRAAAEDCGLAVRRFYIGEDAESLAYCSDWMSVERRQRGVAVVARLAAAEGPTRRFPRAAVDGSVQ